jgi:hypothetical protein
VRKVNDTTYESIRGPGDDWDATLIVGGQTQDKFIPNVNLNRWNDEAYLNLNLNQFVVRDERHKDTDGRVEQRHGNREVVMYEDGREFEIAVRFYSLPTDPNITIALNYSPGITFEYQAPLTRELIADGHRQKDGVPGSIAVFYNNGWGNKYKNGKFAHLYRWRCVDDNKKEAWCGYLSIAEDIMTVPLPMIWMATAAYPVYCGVGRRY